MSPLYRAACGLVVVLNGFVFLLAVALGRFDGFAALSGVIALVYGFAVVRG